MEGFFNHSQLVQSFYTTNQADFASDNITDNDVNITRTYSRLTSPLAVTVAVLLVFLFSPMILIGNSLFLVAMYRFKRLRTPSNYLFISLATSDLGIGMFMPVGMYLELGGVQTLTSVRVCLFSYGVAISLCSVSVLVMVAIAVDRFTSLARPLRYNNLITHSAVERYIVVFWAYSSLVGFTPLGYSVLNHADQYTEICSFGVLVAKPIQLFMFCAVYGPSALVLLVCYGYVYIVARGHARAIRSETRQSTRISTAPLGGAGPPRYGLALAITTGMFLVLWLPFQVCMLTDVFLGTNILTAWISVYLALPILASSAFNPWVYGYRNSELRRAVRRVVDDMLALLGFAHRSRRRSSDQAAPSAAATAGDAGSFINHVQRERSERKAVAAAAASAGDFLLVPMARPESSGVASDCESQRIVLMADAPVRVLKGSRSMVESIAVSRGSDVVVVAGRERGMRHGVSVL
ncbi:unnamed protein product [Phyllotreta striolata]|uniref:G-protein coupled receptors family 1 profile domain-containing protein n=1 Tax=Phyllotreta striolata TaxID=444603 RepID=A0A9N9TQ01_PHYSR|nr:unnamed protein product [Phyllotreta striolata]